MYYDKVRGMNYQLLRQPFALADGAIEIDVKRNRLHCSLMSCGKKMQIGGKAITYHCRKAVCPKCSAFAARRMAGKFMTQFPNAEKEHFSMITLGLNYAYCAREAIAYFNQSRIDIRNGINVLRKRRPSRNPKEFLPWNWCSMSGTLELDAFAVKDFFLLGDEKKRQYIEDFGYDPIFLSEGSIFFVTYHGVIYREGLSDMDLECFFEKHSKRIHLQSLYDGQTTADAVGNVIGYGHKVDYSTTYSGGRQYDWREETLDEYLSAVSFAKGRQPFKFCIKQKIAKEL